MLNLNLTIKSKIRSSIDSIYDDIQTFSFRNLYTLIKQTKYTTVEVRNGSYHNTLTNKIQAVTQFIIISILMAVVLNNARELNDDDDDHKWVDDNNDFTYANNYITDPNKRNIDLYRQGCTIIVSTNPFYRVY